MTNIWQASADVLRESEDQKFLNYFVECVTDYILSVLPEDITEAGLAHLLCDENFELILEDSLNEVITRGNPLLGHQRRNDPTLSQNRIARTSNPHYIAPTVQGRSLGFARKTRTLTQTFRNKRSAARSAGALLRPKIAKAPSTLKADYAKVRTDVSKMVAGKVGVKTNTKTGERVFFNKVTGDTLAKQDRKDSGINVL